MYKQLLLLNIFMQVIQNFVFNALIIQQSWIRNDSFYSFGFLSPKINETF